MTIPHSLGMEEAKRRIRDFLEQNKNRADSKFTNLEHSSSGDMESFKFRAMGFAVAGWFKVEPANLLIELQFPLAALPFRGRAETEILSKVRAILA
jgi:hypothetical protein